jgi:hypothetical protein
MAQELKVVSDFYDLTLYLSQLHLLGAESLLCRRTGAPLKLLGRDG